MKHLIDFKKFSPENIVELKTLEDNSIPLEVASELMQMQFNQKEPILVVPVKTLIEPKFEEIDKIYYNLMNMSSNMNLCLDFNFEDCSFEVLCFFVDKFFKSSRNLKYVPSLVGIVGDCILFSLDKFSKESYFLSDELMEKLSLKFKDDISKSIDFLNSVPLFVMTTLKGFLEFNAKIENVEDLTLEEKSEEMLKLFKSSGIEIVNDIDFISKNIVCLFYNTSFLISYYSIANLDIKKSKYYHQQFNEYMFNGVNLFFHFSNENNLIFHTLNSLDQDGKNLDLFNLLKTIENNN